MTSKKMLNDSGFATTGFATEKIITELNKKQNGNFEKLQGKVNEAIGEASVAAKDSKIGKYCFDEEIVMTDFDNATNLTRS